MTVLPKTSRSSFEHLLKPDAYRKRALLDLTALRQDIGAGYRATAELVLRGLMGTILTTNFDICLPKALNDKQPHIRHVAEVNRARTTSTSSACSRARRSSGFTAKRNSTPTAI